MSDIGPRIEAVPLVLGAEAADFLLEGREVALARESLVAFGLEGLVPGAEEGVV
jgi:hypothetical protein